MEGSKMDEISISKAITESFFNWDWDDELEEDETELEDGLLEELWEIQDFLDGRA